MVQFLQYSNNVHTVSKLETIGWTSSTRMNAFTKVVALGSYAEAGRQLGLTRSAVSKAVMELEQLLGARLLDRTTRRVGPTEAGRAYYERCVDILASIEETELAVSRLHDEPKGVLKINGPMSFGTLYLGSCGRRLHGGVPRLEGRAVAQRSPHRSDRGGSRRHDPHRRTRGLEPHRAQARTGAARSRGLAGVSRPPRRAARRPRISPAIAASTFGHTTTLQRWELTRDGETISVPISSSLCSNNGDVLAAAARNGQGITMLPTFLVGPDIKAGHRLRGDAGISADRARHLRDLCTQPLSRRQDTRADRLSGRPFR